MHNKIAVYTCITGDYDIPKPILKEDGVDYILFTDKPIKSKEWKIVKIPLIDNDPIKTNRWVKIKSLEHLASYKYTVYIDGNLSITKGIKHDVLSNLKDHDLALHKHHRSQSLSEDVPYMFKYGKLKVSDIYSLYKQRIRYIRQGFKYKYFIEANIIYRKNKTEELKNFEDIWFSEFHNHLKRDQLSLCFSIWKSGVKFRLLDSANVRTNIGNYKIYNHNISKRSIFSKIYAKVVLVPIAKIGESVYRSIFNESN